MIENMKVLSTVVLMVVATQLVWTQPLNDPSTAEEELRYYYHVESNLIAGNYCLKLRNISEAILADSIINKSSSQLMHEFKQNLTNFQEIFPFYIRFGHNDTVLRAFSNMVYGFQQAAPNNTDEDFLYIKQLLKNVGWNEIRRKYKKDFKKILPKLNDFKSNISKPSLINWLNNLKDCASFECYLNCYRKHTFTAKDHFVGFLQKELTDMTISFVGNGTLFNYRILKDPRVSKLKTFLRNNLKENINQSLMISEHIENIFHLFWEALTFGSTIPMFADNNNISYKELLLVIQIFNDNGYQDLMTNYRTNYDNFLQYDVLKEYERVKANLSDEELMRDKDFWNTFEKLKGAQTFTERVNIVNGASKEDFKMIRL